MADENTTAVQTEEEIKEIKPIYLTGDRGEAYILEFDRATVKYAEQHGFNTDAETIRITDAEELFFYAFRKHHPNISRADSDKILYEKLHGFPKGMFERLVELFALPYNALVQTEEDEKNATMTAQF